MQKIIIFTTPTCPYCEMVKRYLTEKNFKYLAVDVSEDASAAKKMQEISGQLGVPVIQIENGEKSEVVTGFDKDKLDSILGIKD